MRHRTPPRPSSPRVPFHSTSSLVHFLICCLRQTELPSVDYNEDLSTFHGSTLDVETAYTSTATLYILSLYPPDTSIVIMGYSMDGVVATSLLPSLNISAIITMSTLHQPPPVRFGRCIAVIYDHNQAALATANTPILSLCGGATDLIVPSESCILP